MKQWVKVMECTCERCGHRWLSRVPNPVRCASEKCKSPYWDKPRVRKYYGQTKEEAAAVMPKRRGRRKRKAIAA